MSIWLVNETAIKRFNRLCRITLVAVYFLILVGSVVRSSGSGMGCPDWPRCFGQWVPPNSASELPDNYRALYSEVRQKKNVKFVNMLRAIGLDETAAKLESNKAVLQEEEFSPIKSKIEYVNRLVGVTIGLLISLVLFRAAKFWKSKVKIFLAALVAWISVVFTGWFGSIVVSTNLTPWTVSVHLGFAFLIVAMLVYLVKTTSTEQKTTAIPAWILIGLLAVGFLQMVLGVQVREALDSIAFLHPDGRETWISALGNSFLVHRSFSWLVLAANGWVAWRLYKIWGANWLVASLVILTLGSVLTGVGMAYGAVPPYLQPLHLTFSVLIFGIQFWLVLPSKKTVIANA